VRSKVINHPLVADRLVRLRDRETPMAAFRAALDDIAGFLVYEALRSTPTTRLSIETPVGPATGMVVDPPPLVVPVLRAGLGMLAAAMRLLPDAEVGFVGLKRNEATLEPDPYVTTVPPDLAGRRVLVLDPMLATGGSAEHACRLLADAGAGLQTLVCVLTAPEGLLRLERSGLSVEVVTASIDRHLNERGFIVPGLGDAGDRQFGVA
jgi:uracil phosphoribosyltransferase